MRIFRVSRDLRYLVPLLGGGRPALGFVCGPVGALASHATVTHALAPVACLEPKPLAVRIGAVSAQLRVFGLIDVLLVLRSAEGADRLTS